MKVHHVGIACSDIALALADVKKFHSILDVSAIVTDELQNAELCYVKTGEGLDLELISGPQVTNILKKGASYYHICYEVQDLDGAVQRMTADGAILISPPKPAKLFSGRRVAFLYLSHGLVELLEESL